MCLHPARSTSKISRCLKHQCGPSQHHLSIVGLRAIARLTSLSPLCTGRRTSPMPSTLFENNTYNRSRLFPNILPSEVIISFAHGQQVIKIDRYTLCAASSFFAQLLNTPYEVHFHPPSPTSKTNISPTSPQQHNVSASATTSPGPSQHSSSTLPQAPTPSTPPCSTRTPP